MLKLTPQKRVLLKRTLSMVMVGALLGVFGFSAMLLRSNTPVYAATSSTLNFQARLLGSSGNLVPDGNYHIEFKLFNDSSATGGAQGACSGSCVWRETRTTGNLVRVVNGYFTVNLGSVNAFGSSIDWDQELWLTMNIGGSSGSASWDGEMSPRIKLTAVPFAFRAEQLVKTTDASNSTKIEFATPSGNNTITAPAATGTICLTSGNCTGVGGTGDILNNGQNGTVRIGSNDGNAIYLETNNTDRFTITAGGTTSILGGTGTSVALTVNNGTSTGDILQLKDNGSNVLTVSDGGAVLIKSSTNSTNAFQVQSSGSTTPILNVDTNTRRVGFGTTTPAQPIHISGTHDATSAIRIDSTINRTTSGSVLGFNLTPTLNPLTANSVIGLQVNPTVVADSGETVTIYKGVEIKAPTKSGTGTITDSYQLLIDTTSSAATNNYGVVVGSASTQTLWLSNNTDSGNASAGIAFGASRDTNLYRGAASTLKTDGDLFIGSYSTSNTRLGVKGVGTTTGITLNVTNSADASRFQVLDNGTITLGAFNCTSYTNGGKLTTDASGVLSCANDTGGSGVTTIGALNGGTANADGATISGTTLYLQSASSSFAGLVDTGAQTFAGNKTFSGATVFQTSSDSITGFQVLDQDGGAPVLNVDTVNERVGIGIASPLVKLHVSDDGTAPATNLYSSNTDVLFSKGGNQVNIGLAASNTDFHKVVFAGNRARGTLDTPLAVVSGDAIASFQGSGYDGTTMYTAAGMNFYVDDTVSTGSVPLGISFETGTTTANRATRLTITSGGNIRIGTADATGSLLVLDTKNNDTTDPSGVNGGMYYNSIAGKFRCHQNSSWTDCITSGGSGVTAIGALNGGTANADGATISGTTLYLQSASSSFAGLVDTGAQTFAGAKTFSAGVVLSANQTLTMVGGATAQRPASPVEGMVYFDTTTKQLLTYANGKWQGDRSTARFIVAASNASQSVKDKADYVATGTSDQTQINAAISAANAAGGGAVYLSQGTFSVNATITMLSNVTLIGSGKTTAITVPNGLNPATLLVISNSGTITNAEIRNLAINGNRTGQTSGTIRGVGTVTNGGTVDNVSVSNVDGGAYYVGASTNSLFTNNVADCGYTAATAYSVYITGASNRINANRITNCAALLSSGANNVISNNIIGVGGISSSWAIYVTGNYNTIANNNIASYTGGAIYFSAASVTVSGNTIRATGGDGINTGNNSANAVVSNNTISGISGDGMSFATHNGLSITGNTIEGGTRYGIYSTGLGHSTISGNTIRNNSMIGIYLVNGGGNVVFNSIIGNTISGNTQNGIKFDGVQDSTIADNIIANNGDAATFNSRIRITNYLSTNATRNSIVGNKISSSAASGSAILIASTSVDTYLSSNTLSGTGASSISDSSTSTTYAGQNTSSTGDLRFRTTNSATAFQLQNASGTNFLTADTSTNNRLQVGSSTTDATAILTVLDSFNGATEAGITGVNGSMYYNSSMNKFRCHQAGAWTDCIGAGGGGGVTSLNALTGALSVVGTTNQLTVTPSGSSITLSTPQDLHTAATPTFGAMLLSSAAGTGGNLFKITDTTATARDVFNIADGGAASFQNQTDSTTAFQIMSFSGTVLMSVDTSNTIIRMGTTDSATLSGANLLLTAAEVVSTLRVGNATNGVEFSASGVPVYRGTARPTRTVRMNPEYPGAVISGTSTAATLISNFCSGTSRKSVNSTICGASEEHNYYEITSSASSDTFDIYINYRMPSDFDGFTSSTSINMYGWRTDGTINSIKLSLYDADGTECGTSGGTDVATGTAAWTVTSLGGDETSCTITADEDVIWRVRMTVDASDYIRAGGIYFNYYSKF